MGQSLHGAIQGLAVPAPMFKISSGTFSTFRPQMVLSQRCRLASLHQLTDAKVALLTPHVPDDSAPPHSKAMWLPTWEGGKPNVRQFWVSPLVKDLPTLPEQKLKQTKVRIDSEPLLTFRATIASNLCSRDCWDSCKRNPPAHIYGTFDKGVVHSTFGWREISVPAKKEGVSETFLQGFIRTKKQFATKMDSHVGSDGLFILPILPHVDQFGGFLGMKANRHLTTMPEPSLKPKTKTPL
jgi:hypothetical protein